MFRYIGPRIYSIDSLTIDQLSIKDYDPNYKKAVDILRDHIGKINIKSVTSRRSTGYISYHESIF